MVNNQIDVLEEIIVYDAWDPPLGDPHWDALDYVLTAGSELLGDDGSDLVLDVGFVEAGARSGCQMYGLDGERSVRWVTARALRELAVAIICSPACPDGARDLLVEVAGEVLPRRRQSMIAEAAAAHARAPGPPARYSRTPRHDGWRTTIVGT